MALTAFKYSLQEEDEIRDGTVLDDDKAFEKIFKEHYRKLTIFANRFLNDLSVSQEVVSDTFTYLWENRNHLAITTSINAYLHKMVQNRCLNYLKHRKIESDYVNYLVKNDLMEQNHYTINHCLQQKELELQVQRAMDELPERCREIFKLSRFEYLKNKEIAERLNISTKAVERQMTIALGRLRHHLQHLFIFISVLLLR